MGNNESTDNNDNTALNPTTATTHFPSLSPTTHSVVSGIHDQNTIHEDTTNTDKLFTMTNGKNGTSSIPDITVNKNPTTTFKGLSSTIKDGNGTTASITEKHSQECYPLILVVVLVSIITLLLLILSGIGIASFMKRKRNLEKPTVSNSTGGLDQIPNVDDCSYTSHQTAIESSYQFNKWHLTREAECEGPKPQNNGLEKSPIYAQVKKKTRQNKHKDSSRKRSFSTSC